MRRWTRFAVAPAAALALAAAACGDGEDTASDEGDLLDMINESERLSTELNNAELQVVEHCLEEQGFTVHDQYSLSEWEAYEQDELIGYYPFDGSLPEAEDAAEAGFEAWVWTPEGEKSGGGEAYYDEKYGEEEGEFGGDSEGDWEDPDNSEFEALSAQEQWEWYVAYQGEERAKEWYGGVSDIEASNREQELTEGMSEEELNEYYREMEEQWAAEEGEAEGEDGGSGEDGAIEVEGEEWVDPEPGGCELEMIEGLYGEPELIEESYEEGDSYSYWSYGIDDPRWSEDQDKDPEAELRAEYFDRIAEVESELLDCIRDAGHGNWEFSEWGDLPTWMFWDQVYYAGDEEMDYELEESDGVVPEVPADMPTDFEGQKAAEIAMAVDFAACADDTGFRDAATKAWDDVQLDYYTDLEEPMFAYQEELRDAIDKAQQMIAG